MDKPSLLANVVAKVGDAAILWRRLQGGVPAQAVGAAPTIPEARPQGAIPTLKMPTAQGWAAGQLEDELGENVWLTADADPELIFDADYDGKWAKALAGLGVDPAQLSGQSGRA